MNWLDSLLKPGSNLSLILIALAAASLGGVMLTLIGLQASERQRKRDVRINRSTGQARTLRNRPKTPTNVRLQTATSRFGAVDTIIRRMVPNLAKFRARLRRTGHDISIDYYLLSCLLLGVLAGECAKVFLGLSWTRAISIGVVTGLVVPHFIVGFMGRRRLKRLLDQFPDVVDMIVRAVRSGLPVSEAVKVIAEQSPPPLGHEFQQIVDAMKLGSTLNEALDAAMERIEIPEFRFFIIALSIQQDTGGNLGETLENLSKMVRRRRAMKRKIKAISAEARASAWLLGCLPFAMFGILMSINRAYESILLTDPRGITIILTGLTMTSVGVAIMVKLSKFEI